MLPHTDALLADVLARLRVVSHRWFVGIAGIPGAGKSTLATWLAEQVNAALGPGVAVVVAMDGYHLTNAELDARGFRARKGAPHTYDARALVATLAALRRQRPGDPPVGAPIYSRELHEPVPGALQVGTGCRLVLTEGQYLLLDEPPWNQIPPLLDERWYLELDLETALERVLARHMRGGNTQEQAERRIRENDRPNALLVQASRPRADRVVACDDVRPERA
jgi:pantothenate kinase